MSLTYGGTTYRSLEEQVRKNMEDISTEAESLSALTDKVYNFQTGGTKVSLTFPAGASSGTVTAEQLATLQANDANYIEMVNDKELYYLNDPGHVEGFLTYSHVGIENSKATIKTLTITVSAKSFVIVTTVVPTESGGKYYAHKLTLSASAGSSTRSILKCLLIDTKTIAYDKVEDLSLATRYNSLIPLSYTEPQSDGTGHYKLICTIGWNSAASIPMVEYLHTYDTYSTSSYPLYGLEIVSDAVTEL